jgi:predicted AAA+ superfamily ATPase
MVKELKYKLEFNNTKLKWSNPDFTGLIDEQLKRIENKKPSVMVIDGVHSGGKTTFAGHIGQYVESKYNQEFDYANQVGKGMDKFLEKLKWCRENGRKKFCIYDEAEDFDRKGAMSKLNRLLNRIFSITENQPNHDHQLFLGSVKMLEKQSITKRSNQMFN